jgi:hypothetical protein
VKAQKAFPLIPREFVVGSTKYEAGVLSIAYRRVEVSCETVALPSLKLTPSLVEVSGDDRSVAA